MDNFGKIVWLIVRAPFVVLIVAFNVNLWTLDVDEPTTTDSLDAITADLRAGAGGEMQQMFPEGFTITHALAGFGWVDVALSATPGSSEHAHALEQARWLESQVDSDEGRRIFSDELNPSYGAFYRGYLAWLRGGILLADPDDPPDEVARFAQDCQEIAAALRAADTPYLESYHNMAWPADSVFLAASLALHDELFAPLYRDDVARWVQMSKVRRDDRLGMVPHYADPVTGEPTEQPRGTSNAVMSRMLYEVDPGYSLEQYRKTREHFAVAHLGLFPGIYEYARGRSGAGDVDSGPLIFGISASASTVAVAAARLHGDREFADPTLIGLHAVGMPLADRYGLGLLPVGEAFIAWTKSTRPWVGPPPQPRQWEPLMLPGWRFVWHLLSLLVLAALFSGELVAFARRRRTQTID